MLIDFISYYTNHILFEYGFWMILYYVLSHVLWGLYFRHQGALNWYLALLPFKLQFMKMGICYDDSKLPIVYTVLCVLCCSFFPLWIIPAIIVVLINRKFYDYMIEDYKPTLLSIIPLLGKYIMLREVVDSARDESV